MAPVIMREIVDLEIPLLSETCWYERPELTKAVRSCCKTSITKKIPFRLPFVCAKSANGTGKTHECNAFSTLPTGVVAVNGPVLYIGDATGENPWQHLAVHLSGSYPGGDPPPKKEYGGK